MVHPYLDGQYIPKSVMWGTITHNQHKYNSGVYYVDAFSCNLVPRPCPAFHCFQYGKALEPGNETGFLVGVTFYFVGEYNSPWAPGSHGIAACSSMWELTSFSKGRALEAYIMLIFPLRKCMEDLTYKTVIFIY